MSDTHVDETLEAVALVLRDLKTNFEQRLSQVETIESTEREGFLTRLMEVSQAVDTIAARTTSDRQDLEARLEEMRQHLEAALDRQREESAAWAKEQHAFIENLQGKTSDVETVGEKAVRTARATQESILRLAEEVKETKEAIKPLAEGLDDARARHQTVLTELTELDAKTLIRGDLDNLQSWTTARLDSLAEKLSALDERFEEFQKLNQETRDLFQQIGAECKSLADNDEEYQEKFAQALKGLASRQDLEIVQNLLEETVSRSSDALDSSQKAAEQTDRVFEEHRAQTQTAIEALQNTFSERQEQLRDQISQMRKVVSSDLAAEMRASIIARGKESDQMLIRQAEQFITKLSENIRGERGPAGHVSRVQQWVPNYQFQELALVRHRAGLWQAVCDTSEEPCEDCKDWNSVAVGIRSVAVSPDETPGSYRLSALDSADFVHTTEFHVPLPTFHKTWDAEHEYRHYDSVMEDGHRWLAVVDDPKGPPSRSEDWILLGMRGGRGARGAKGDPGPTGPEPDMEEILDAYDQRRLEANGTPISSFRGSWRFGADYVVGDFVRGEGVMALCRKAHRAENPPTGQDARWEILFEPPDLGAQVAALTAQVEALARRDG